MIKQWENADGGREKVDPNNKQFSKKKKVGK